MLVSDIFSTNIQFDIRLLPSETVELAEADARVAAEDVAALLDCPAHSESLRDGYVLASTEIARPSTIKTADDAKHAEEYCYPVVGEIAAGPSKVRYLAPGTACRIFTGGVIPEGSDRVVPQELCAEREGKVRVDAAAFYPERLFIRRAGSEAVRGQKLIAQGVRLQVDDLILLAAAGVHRVQVATRPRIACFCTGSELVAVGKETRDGQKLSLNSLLLQTLIPQYGGIIVKQGIISDSHREITRIFAGAIAGGCDLVISTGGMGPGKYDLVKKAFTSAGGEIVLDSLPMHPGRSIVFGTLGSTVFIALPGPPNAVRTLMNEFVGPILLKMQGAEFCWPRRLKATLLHDYRIRASDLLQVKGGVLEIRQGCCMVRLAEYLDPLFCFILFPPGQEKYLQGEAVWVHLATTHR